MDTNEHGLGAIGCVVCTQMVPDMFSLAENVEKPKICDLQLDDNFSH